MDNPQHPTRKFLKARSHRRNNMPPTFFQSRQIFQEPVPKNDDVSYENPCKRQKFTYQEVAQPPGRPEPTVENSSAAIPILKCTIGKKSSANARLVTYRNILSSTNERVKLHTLEVVRQVNETPTTSLEVEGINRLENSVSPNKTVERQYSNEQTHENPFYNGGNLGKSPNAVELKRSHSLQDRLKKYKLPKNDICDITVQNNNAATVVNSDKTVNSASKTTESSIKSIDLTNKTVKHNKKTIDYTSNTNYNPNKTNEHISTTNVTKTFNYQNTDIGTSKKTLDYCNKPVDNPKKVVSYTSKTIVNPNKTTDYTNKSVFNHKKTIKNVRNKSIKKPKKTFEYTNVRTYNPNEIIDCTNYSTYSSKKTIDYTVPTHNPNKTIDLTNDLTYNPNYTNDPLYISNKTIEYTTESTHTSNKTIDYTNKITDASNKTNDYSFEAAVMDDSNKTLDFTTRKTDMSNKTVDYTNRTVDTPNKTIDFSFKAAAADSNKTVDYTNRTLGTPNKTIDFSFEATQAVNSNKAIDYTYQTTESVNKPIDYSYKATEKGFLLWQSHNNNESAEANTNEGNNIGNWNTQNVESPFVNTNFSGDIFGNRPADDASDFYEEEMDWSPVEDSFVLENVSCKIN